LQPAIDKAFRKAGITIAIPQRDVRLNPPHRLKVRVMPERNFGTETDRLKKIIYFRDD
jgi:small-conductance mechanosensitive channel